MQLLIQQIICVTVTYISMLFLHMILIVIFTIFCMLGEMQQYIFCYYNNSFLSV